MATEDEQLYQQYLQEKKEKELYQQYLREKGQGSGTPSDPASQQNQEEQFDPWAVAKGAGSLISGAYNTVRHPIDTYDKVSNALENMTLEQGLRTVGKGALAIAGGGVGVLGGPVGVAAGATAGAHLFDKLNQLTGSDPVTSPTQDVNNLMYNFGGNALVPVVAQGVSRVKNAILPSETMINWNRAQGEAPAANILNIPGKETDARIMFAENLGRKQAAFLEANPMGGINPEDPTAWAQFRGNMRRQTTDAKVLKYNTIQDVDLELQAGNAPLLTLDRNSLQSHINSLPPESRAYVTERQVNAAQNYIDQNFTTAPQASMLVGPNGQPLPPRPAQPIPHNLTEAHEQMGVIDNALKQLKRFDANAQSAKDLNPSALAANQDTIAGLGLVKEMLARAINDTANLAIPGAGEIIEGANRTISSLKDYQTAARIRGFQAARGTSPQAPGSLNTNVRTAGELTGLAGLANTATGGLIDTLNQRRLAAASQGLLSNDLQNLQNLEGLIGSPRPQMVSPEAAASYQALVNAVRPVYQPSAPPLLSRDFGKVKDDPAQWAQFHQNAQAALGVDVNKMPDIPQQQVFQQLLQTAPQIATPPATRYQSAITIDGETKVSGIDKDLAMQKAVTIKDPEQRAMQLGGLMKDGTLLPEPQGTTQPAPEPMPANPMAPLNWLSSEEQSAQAGPPSAPSPFATDSDNMLAKMKEASSYVQ